MDKMKQVAQKAVKSHEQRMHKMAKGGPTSMAMKKVGRNLARAQNQGGKGAK